MALFRPSRETRGPDPYLRLKSIAFVIGAAAGLAGILTDNGWLVAIGIGALAAGMLLRILSQRR